MRLLKLLAIIFVAAIAVTLLASKSSTNAPAAAAPADPHKAGVSASIAACEIVTRHVSKLAVGEIVDEYELTGKAKPGHYRVGFDYRTQGTGLLMASNCEYDDAGNGKIALVRQISALK